MFFKNDCPVLEFDDNPVAKLNPQKIKPTFLIVKARKEKNNETL